MNKYFLLVLGLITTSVFWNYQEFKIPGGLGFIRNNLAWLAIIGFASFYSYQIAKHKKLNLFSYWRLSLTGIGTTLIPFAISSKFSFEVSWLLPFGLIGCWLLLIAFLQNKTLNLKSEYILFFIVLVTAVEIILGYGYVLHRLAMDYTSNIAFKAPNLEINFNQRNLYASFLSTGLISSFYLILTNQLTRQRKPQLIALFFAGSFLLFFTESRVGIYSYIAGVIFLSLAYLKSHLKQVSQYAIAIFVTAFTAYSSMSALYENGAKKDFSKTTHREFIYTTSAKAILDKPIFGHGLGSFTKAYTEKTGERVNSNNLPYDSIKGRPENLSHPHNELLYWGVQGGLISIVGLLLIALSIYLNLAKLDILKQLRYFALLAPIGLHLMVELPFYISTVHLMVFIGLIGFILLDSKSIKTIEVSSNTAKLGYGFAIFMAMLSIPIANNIYGLTKAVRFQTDLNPNIQDLESIRFPLGWHNELEEVRLRYYANIAVKQGEKAPIIEFTKWLEGYNEKYPILQNYFNLYYSYQFLEQPEKAQIIKEKVATQYLGITEAENWLKNLD